MKMSIKVEVTGTEPRPLISLTHNSIVSQVNRSFLCLKAPHEMHALAKVDIYNNTVSDG